MAAMPLGMLPSCFLETEAQPATVLPGIALGRELLGFHPRLAHFLGAAAQFPVAALKMKFSCRSYEKRVTAASMNGEVTKGVGRIRGTVIRWAPNF
jgi:hypothetical protein